MHHLHSTDRRTILRQRIGWLAGAGLILMVLITLVAYPRIKTRWQTPLGPALELPTLTPSPLQVALVKSPTISVYTPAGEAAAASSATTETQTPASLPPQPSTPSAQPPTATVTPEPLCGAPALMTILAIGADNRDNTYLYGLADVMRIARIDFVNARVTVLSLPRDLWVEIPEISGHYGITHGKLNQAYLYGGPGMGYYDGPGGGPGLLARTLDLNFGLRVDHYGGVNMQTFTKIVDAVGGLDVYLPTDVDGTPIDDRTEDMGYFTAGHHHFTGKLALRFARIRKRYNDFTRADNQTLVMCALREKLLTPAILPKLPKIINAFQGSVQTDLSLEQISQLACLLPNVKRENLIFTSLPDEIYSPGRMFSENLKDETFILEADFAVIRDYVQQFMAGDWPTQLDEPSCP